MKIIHLFLRFPSNKHTHTHANRMPCTGNRRMCDVMLVDGGEEGEIYLQFPYNNSGSIFTLMIIKLFTFVLIMFVMTL